ncbi:MAG: hypothetical protein RLZZ124_1600 [Cyanobacteriota bacterium]
MPLLSIQTSAPAPAEAGGLLGELSRDLAGWLDKPERSVMTLLETDLPMTFAGDPAPCAYLQVKSIGALDGDRPAAISASLCSLLAQRLGVPGEMCPAACGQRIIRAHRAGDTAQPRHAGCGPAGRDGEWRCRRRGR